MINIKNDLCDFCGTCVSVCPEDAIELLEARLVIDQEKCSECKKCVKVCPFEVLEVQS
jgi:ferredoxin